MKGRMLACVLVQQSLAISIPVWRLRAIATFPPPLKVHVGGLVMILIWVREQGNLNAIQWYTLAAQVLPRHRVEVALCPVGREREVNKGFSKT